MNKQSLIEFLSEDYLLNASIIEPLKNGTATVVYFDGDCAMVKDNASPVYMLRTEDTEKAKELVSKLSARDVLVAHNKVVAEVFADMGYKNVPCYQAVYRKERFEFAPNIEIRLLREDESRYACEMYGFTEEEAAKHISLGLVYGGFAHGEAVGMIGFHLQGSMGMLEVKQNFRRKGYAAEMEKFLINMLLAKKQVPYCQIVEGNEASLSLQRKLGLDISENMLYWLHK